MNKEFEWTEFYPEFANAIRSYAKDRESLIHRLKRCYTRIDASFPRMDYDGEVRDIDPFTVFGLFNKGISNSNRVMLISAIKEEFGIKAKVPEQFNGIPVLNNMMSCYFAYSNDPRHGKDDINNLWRIFELGQDFADGNEKLYQDFVDCWDKVIRQFGVKWNLTMGLYWIRPRFFVNLDKVNRDYIRKDAILAEKINAVASNVLTGQMPSGVQYLDICKTVANALEGKSVGSDSLPELSYNAWKENQESPKVSVAKTAIGYGVPFFWKISHGTNNTGLSKVEREDCERRNVITLHSKTPGAGTSRISQGDLFMHALRRGDFAYLCYAGEVKRLIQITDDECRPSNLEKDWVERSYRVIAETKNENHYPAHGFRKVWTPNNNSTFVRIPDEAYADFDDKLLRPYFGKDTKELLELYDKDPMQVKCWWLMANPGKWDPNELSKGQEEFYTLFDGTQKRKHHSAFLGCREGDLLLVYVTRNLHGICAIFKCSKSQDGEKIWFEKIADIPNPVTREEIIKQKELRDMLPIKSPQGSLFKITKNQFDGAMDLVRKKNPDFKLFEEGKVECVDAEKPASYGAEKFLEQVFISEDKYREMVSVLEKKKNIILTGAPGVGKTFAARRLAWAMMGERDDERVEFIQFHQSYAYEDFICGYKPSTDGGFVLREGVFYTFCKKAENDPDRPYFFIIDEVNRGNISKIFGELLMLIEADKRGDQAYAVRLAYKPDEMFTVPKNLHVIGLMNTADRSLAMMDYALRRRFSFVSMEPGFDSEGFAALVSGDDKMQRLVDAVKKLNEVIVADASLGKGFVIGHSFFCGRLSPEEIVRYDIGPTLDEYWFDNQSKAEEERTKLLNAIR